MAAPAFANCLINPLYEKHKASGARTICLSNKQELATGCPKADESSRGGLNS